MIISVSGDKATMGRRAAETGAQHIRVALARKRDAHIVLATGASQFDMLSSLVQLPGIEWGRVTAFHLDEYIGLSSSHAASFRRYLKDRFVDALPQPLRKFHYIAGETDPERERQRLGDLVQGVTIDVAFIGIGENGHLAFNDPPADFQTEEPYLIVRLDEACRRQQLGEGWFADFRDVPGLAISMSVRQILKSVVIVCTVPDQRKAKAVRNAVEGPITPAVPASILQRHENCHVFLDRAAAELLSTDSVFQ